MREEINCSELSFSRIVEIIAGSQAVHTLTRKPIQFAEWSLRSRCSKYGRFGNCVDIQLWDRKSLGPPPVMFSEIFRAIWLELTTF